MIRGTGFTLTPFSRNENLTKEMGDEYFLWCRIRDNSQTDELSQLPSFTAVQSILQKGLMFHITAKSFVPILRYPATKMDSIFTTMLNFQDVLRRRNQTEGALWCDEGVYAFAKEVQILKPEQINIFKWI